MSSLLALLFYQPSKSIVNVVTISTVVLPTLYLKITLTFSVTLSCDFRPLTVISDALRAISDVCVKLSLIGLDDWMFTFSINEIACLNHRHLHIRGVSSFRMHIGNYRYLQIKTLWVFLRCNNPQQKAESCWSCHTSEFEKKYTFSTQMPSWQAAIVVRSQLNRHLPLWSYRM